MCLDLLQSIQHPASGLLREAFNFGFTLFGELPGVGLLGPPDSRATPSDLDEFLGEAEPQVLRWLQQRKPEPRFAEHSERNSRMVSEGKFIRRTLVELRGRRVLVSPSFTIVEDRGSGPKLRQCDDLSASGGNSCAASRERLVLPSVDDWLADAARIHAEFPAAGALISVEDEDGAFTNWPARETWALVLMLIGPDGHYELHESTCLNFGGYGCVFSYAYARLALTDIARWCLAIPARAYVDDTGIVEPAFAAWSGVFCFRALHTLLGVPLKQPPKRHEPSGSNPLLGTVLAVGTSPPSIEPQLAKVARATAACAAALRQNHLSPAGASRLANRLNFLSSQLYARAGRIALLPLFEWQRIGGSGRLDARRRSALRVAQEVLQWAPARVWPGHATDTRPSWLVYTDAAGEDPVNGCGLLLAAVQSDGPQLVDEIHFVFPPDVLALMRNRKNCIGVLEMAMPLVATIIWGTALCLRPYLCFVDNDGAGFALAKGLSGDPDFDALLSAFWAVNAALATLPWICRVPSASNPADALSHGRFSARSSPNAAKSVAALHCRLQPVWTLIRSVFAEEGVASASAVAAVRRTIFLPGQPPPGLPLLPTGSTHGRRHGHGEFQ